MNKETIVETRNTKTSKDINNLQSRKIAQDEIDKQKEEFYKNGGKNTILKDDESSPFDYSVIKRNKVK